MTRLHWLLTVLGLLGVVTLISLPFQYRPPDPAAAAPAGAHVAHFLLNNSVTTRSTGGHVARPPAAKGQPDQWWKGGTLHNASITAWRAASQADKVATAGDWLANTTWKGHIDGPADLDRVRVKATMLAHNMDIMVSDPRITDASAGATMGEMAAFIIRMANDLGP